jgi:hypothetical protein
MAEQQWSNPSESELLELVKEHQPILYQPNHDKHEPKFMYYRTKIEGETLHITYYTVWDNERHPRYLFHVIYAFLFRKFYYGSIKDIEYIQVDVNLKTKEVTDIRYEQTYNPNYNITFPFHVRNHLKKVPSPSTNENTFIRFFGKRNNFHGLIKPQFTGKRVHMMVSSWNHIYNVYMEDIGKQVKNLGDQFNTFSSLMLKKYDPNDLKKYKANRRSKSETENFK